MLGFKSIRRRQGDEYFYNVDVNHCSLQKLFKKNQGSSNAPPLPVIKRNKPILSHPVHQSCEPSDEVQQIQERVKIIAGKDDSITLELKVT